jgi:hypothetical protein
LKDLETSIVVSGRNDVAPLELRGVHKVINRIKAMPTADVVPVVRCKDCKHYERPDLEEDNYFCTAEHTNKLFSPNKTDYCSYGERKNDNG